MTTPPPEEDIRRTLARYCMLCDDGRFDEFALLFCEDATFHVMGTTYTGRDAIKGFMEKGQPPELRGKHVAVNSLIEGDGWGGTASAWTDYIFVAQDGSISSQGRYHDRLVREGDKVWRFASREIVFRGGSPEISDPPPAEGGST
jgi:3-phenylpropionate/cinnamic acid dioxygenase small subunit